MFTVTTSQFNEPCLKRSVQQGPIDGPHLRRGDWRHLIIAPHLFLRCSLLEAFQHATKMAPEQAEEFDGEAEEILYGIQQALNRFGPLPDPEDVVAVEMLMPANIPEWARADVRGKSGIRVQLTDEYALATGGLDFVFREWGPRGDCALVIVNWKGKPGDHERQAKAEATLAWRLGWAEGCTMIRHECRGLVYPWVSAEAFPVPTMPEIADEVLGWIREREAATLSEAPPATVNEYCYSCALRERCNEVVVPVVEPDAAVYMGGPISEAPTETIVAAMESLEPRVKVAQDLLVELEAEIEKRIEAGTEKGFEIKKTPCRYDNEDHDELRKIATWLKFKKDEVQSFVTEKLQLKQFKAALKARATLIGKVDELDARLKVARGEPTAFRKEIVRKQPALPPAEESTNG